MGSLFAFGSAYVNNEMIILQTAGLSDNYFRWRIFIVILPIALVVFLLVNILSPMANKLQNMLEDETSSNIPVKNISIGRFNNLPNDLGVFYAEAVDKDSVLSNIWLSIKSDGDDVIINAKKGYFDTNKKVVDLVLENGSLYKNLFFNPNTSKTKQDKSQQIIQFSEFRTNLPDLSSDVAIDTETKSKFTWQLLGSNKIDDIVAMQNRLLIFFSCILFALLGFKMSRMNKRKGGFSVKVMLALVFYIFYNQIVYYGQDMVRNGTIPEYIGLYPLPFLLLLYCLQSRF